MKIKCFVAHMRVLCCVLLLASAGCESDLMEDVTDAFDGQDESEAAATTNSTDVGESEGTTESGSATQTVAVAVDEIPLADVVWLHTDVGSWEITSELKVSLSGSLIVYDQDGTAKWPPASAIGGEMAGNAWVFAMMDGAWYGATHEWMLPGQTHKNKSSVAGDHIKQYDYFPESWTPTPGVRYGFMVSGLARNEARNVEERTQITLMTWE